MVSIAAWPKDKARLSYKSCSTGCDTESSQLPMQLHCSHINRSFCIMAFLSSCFPGLSFLIQWHIGDDWKYELDHSGLDPQWCFWWPLTIYFGHYSTIYWEKELLAHVLLPLKCRFSDAGTSGCRIGELSFLFLFLKKKRTILHNGKR